MPADGELGLISVIVSPLTLMKRFWDQDCERAKRWVQQEAKPKWKASEALSGSRHNSTS